MPKLQADGGRFDRAERLALVGRQFDDLIRGDSFRLDERVQWGVQRYLDMYAEFVAERKRREDARAEALLALLRSGRTEPDLAEGDRLETAVVAGWFPTGAMSVMQPGSKSNARLRARHEAQVRRAEAKRKPTPAAPRLPDRVQAKLAGAALPIVERVKANPTEKAQAGKRPGRGWVWADIVIRYVCPPHAVGDPTPPCSQEWDYLRSLPVADLLAICYARLAALRDCRSLTQLYDWRMDRYPREGLDDMSWMLRWSQLDSLLPLAQDQMAAPPPVLDPEKCAPDLAERMLLIVKDDLAPGKLFFDETGALRQQGEVGVTQYLKAIRRQLDLLLAHVELAHHSATGDHVLERGGATSAAHVLWDHVSALASGMRGLAVMVANPLTAEQRTKFKEAGFVAQGPIGPHRNFVPIDSVLEDVLRARPFHDRGDGVVVVRESQMRWFRRIGKLLDMHAGSRPEPTDAEPGKDDVEKVALEPGPERLEFKPANFFGKKLAERLRQATRAGRKIKKVRFKKDDGVKLYCVADARKWWPSLPPKR